MFKKGDKVKASQKALDEGSLLVGEYVVQKNGEIRPYGNSYVIKVNDHGDYFELVEGKTIGLTLKEAVCAMIDGERVTVRFNNNHVIFFEEEEGFLYRYKDTLPVSAMAILSTDNTYSILPKKKPTLTFEGGTYLQEDFYAAIKDLREVQC